MPAGSLPVAGGRGVAGSSSGIPVEVVLHEQHDRVGTVRSVTGVVRIRRRIITETRQVDVVVRREVLEFDPPVSPGNAGVDEVFDIDAERTSATGPGQESVATDRDLVLELRAEVPVVVTEVRPVERVRIGLRRVPGAAEITTTTAREHVDISDPRS